MASTTAHQSGSPTSAVSRARNAFAFTTAATAGTLLLSAIAGDQSALVLRAVDRTLWLYAAFEVFASQRDVADRRAARSVQVLAWTWVLSVAISGIATITQATGSTMALMVIADCVVRVAGLALVAVAARRHRITASISLIAANAARAIVGIAAVALLRPMTFGGTDGLRAFLDLFDIVGSAVAVGAVLFVMSAASDMQPEVATEEAQVRVIDLLDSDEEILDLRDSEMLVDEAPTLIIDLENQPVTSASSIGNSAHQSA